MDYSEVLFKTFGDRVKNWVTINEPKVLALYGYENGWAPPGRCSLQRKEFSCNVGGNSTTEPYLAAHNLILAHTAAYRLYKEKYQVNIKIAFSIVQITRYKIDVSQFYFLTSIG